MSSIQIDSYNNNNSNNNNNVSYNRSSKLDLQYEKM